MTVGGAAKVLFVLLVLLRICCLYRYSWLSLMRSGASASKPGLTLGHAALAAGYPFSPTNAVAAGTARGQPFCPTINTAAAETDARSGCPALRQRYQVHRQSQ